MPDSPEHIECSRHGDAYPTYVCQHLIRDPRQEWFCDYPSDDNPWPDAWCKVCDKAFQKEGEWNDRNEGELRVSLLCHCCYEDFKGESVVPLVEERAAFWKPLLSEAVSELQRKQDHLEERFTLSRHKRWDWNQESGELIFSNAGVPAVAAQFQFVGSVSTISDTWLWSWANSSLLPTVFERVLDVRTFGETHQLANLTVPKWPAEEVDGWDMTAVAVKVVGAQGAYRTPSDTGYSFLLLMNVRQVQ